MKDVCRRRFRIVELTLNCDWRARNYPSKRAFLDDLAQKNSTTVKSIERWRSAYKKTHRVADLAVERPGPAPGTHYCVPDDVIACIHDAHLRGQSPAQAHHSYLQYHHYKPYAYGNRIHTLYPPPHSEATTRRIIKSFSAVDNALRLGPDAVHATAGHIQRRYNDLVSLQRVEADEWRFNLFVYDAQHPTRVFRPWLLLFLDARSTYPLVWEIVRGSDTDTRHGISEEDEIELVERLVWEYGVPEELSTDRGRFRGNTWGGKPIGKTRDRQFQHADGVLDALPIVYNRSRKSNPRAMRFHLFALFLSNQCQGLPGYVGRNTVEKKHTQGPTEIAAHKEWAAGQRGRKSPLLSDAELPSIVNGWMEQWRDHPSDGTDMCGLSPRAVFVHNTPVAGFRRIPEEELAFATAQHFLNETMEVGGIITLPDHKSYSHPRLIQFPGQQREVVRLRHDDSQIFVFPARKGEENIITPLCVRVGTHDQEELSRQCEMQAKIEKLIRQFGPRREPSEYPPVPMTAEPARNGEPPKPLPEVPSESLQTDEPAVPSFYDFKPMTAEEL